MSTRLTAEHATVTPLLQVEQLAVHTETASPRRILDGVTFSIAPGEKVGLVGNSGSGKSSIGNAIIGLLPSGLMLAAESRILLDGKAIHALPQSELRQVRGRRVAMVFQEPLLALNPAARLGEQLFQALAAHGVPPEDADGQIAAMLKRCGFPEPAEAAQRFPHELSGGMRQRALLAMALLLRPALIIADEPTTALDPTLQQQLLDLLDELRAEFGTALLLISHDLDVVAERCSRVLVLENGRIALEGPAQQVVAARRRAVGIRSDVAADATPVARVEQLAVHFRTREGSVHAVEDVSFTIARGECLGVIGESGCGKTTLARAMLGLVPLSGGSIHVAESSVATLSGDALRRLRKRIQLVPQDAGASLTPQRSVGELIAEGALVHGLIGEGEALARTEALLREVGLDPAFASRRPRRLSTGERQRVAIARALACEPEILVCDEPVANVDAEAREQLLALLDRLRVERRLALLLISHDLDAVERLATRAIAMYRGRVLEAGPTAQLLHQPTMPYTRALRDARPTGLPRTPPPKALEMPSMWRGEGACPFYSRCAYPLKDDRCRSERPSLLPVSQDQPGHLAACWHVSLPRTP